MQVISIALILSKVSKIATMLDVGCYIMVMSGRGYPLCIRPHLCPRSVCVCVCFFVKHFVQHLFTEV